MLCTMWVYLADSRGCAYTIVFQPAVVGLWCIGSVPLRVKDTKGPCNWPSRDVVMIIGGARSNCQWKGTPDSLPGVYSTYILTMTTWSLGQLGSKRGEISTSPNWEKTGTSITSASYPFENCSYEVRTRRDHQPQSTRLSPLFRAPEEESTASLSSSLGYQPRFDLYSVLLVAHQLLIALTFVNGWSLCQFKGIAMVAFMAVRLRWAKAQYPTSNQPHQCLLPPPKALLWQRHHTGCTRILAQSRTFLSNRLRLEPLDSRIIPMVGMTRTRRAGQRVYI